MASGLKGADVRDITVPLGHDQEPEDTDAAGQVSELAVPNGTASARAITTNFITGGLGSAIFSLPWSVAGSSIVSSVVIVGAVLLLNGWTISIIVHAADRYGVFDLGSVIGHLGGRMGPPLKAVTNFFVWISMFLCLVSYIIVIHDNAEEFLKDTWLNNRFLLVTLASIFVTPLCFLDLKILEMTSSVAIAINVYVLLLVGTLYFQKVAEDKLPSGSCLFGGTVRGNVAMITVMFQAVIIQMCVLPMYKELADRTPRKFDKIVAVGFGTLFFIFCGFSIAAYMLVGPEVTSDVLQDLTKVSDTAWTRVAQAGVMLVVACVYPIMVYPMIEPLQAMGTGRIGITAAKLGIVVAGLLVSSQIQSLGFVNVLNGAMSAGIFVALVPSVVGLVLLDSSPRKRAALWVLLVGGLTVSVAGLVFNQNYLEDLKCYLPA